MEISYFKQKPSKNFEILDRINIVCSNTNGIMDVQIYPFKVRFKDKEYSFAGLNKGAWNPSLPCAILAEIDENDHLFLTVVNSDMLQEYNDNFSETLGIIMFFDKNKIVVVNHKEAA